MLNMHFPSDGRKVLAFVLSEQTWLPLTWHSKERLWHFSIRDGQLAANYPPEDIQAWIDDKYERRATCRRAGSSR
jgi:hypothetical protein